MLQILEAGQQHTGQYVAPRTRLIITAIQVAVGEERILKTLFRHPEFDPLIATRKGATILHLACREDSPQVPSPSVHK